MNAQERLWAALKRLSDAAPVELCPLIDAVSEAAEAARLDERRTVADLVEALSALRAWLGAGKYGAFCPVCQLRGSGGPTEAQIAEAEEIDARVKAALGKAGVS